MKNLNFLNLSRSRFLYLQTLISLAIASFNLVLIPHTHFAMASSILYQNQDKTIFLIDIPRSLEVAQGESGSTRRIISSKPLENPYPSFRPKAAKAIANTPIASLEDIILQQWSEIALQDLKNAYNGSWCLERVVKDEWPEDEGSSLVSAKRRRISGHGIDTVNGDEEAATPSVTRPIYFSDEEDKNVGYYCYNLDPKPRTIQVKSSLGTARVPPWAKFVNGDIETTINRVKGMNGPWIFHTLFDLIIIDPPWPNRSARNSRKYKISKDNSSTRRLLSSLSLRGHMSDPCLVGIWITNKKAIRDMLLGEGGLFGEWGLVLIEEWIWLKVTENGEPVFDADSTWRKPWEILLIGRGRGLTPDAAMRERDSDFFCDGYVYGDVTRRFMAAVPDLHSRKPNLAEIFNEVFGAKQKPYGARKECLEIFARNLTSGWWSWGNEVLKFQMEDCWVDSVTETPTEQ